MISELLAEKKLTKYRISRNTGLPYSTVSDIVSGKTSPDKCSAETIYKLAKAIGISMEALLEPYLYKRISFELFKGNVCHKLKELGDLDFIIYVLEGNSIREYFGRKWYPESLYLLAMLDHISRINHIPLCSEYNVLRGYKLKDTIYPAGVIAAVSVSGTDDLKKKSARAAIPEFLRHNIVESEIRDVV